MIGGECKAANDMNGGNELRSRLHIFSHPPNPLFKICIRRESYNVPQFRSMSQPAHTCIPLVYNDRNSDIYLTTTSIERIMAPTLQEVRSRCRIRVQGLGQLNDSHASHLPAMGILESRALSLAASCRVVGEV